MRRLLFCASVGFLVICCTPEGDFRNQTLVEGKWSIEDTTHNVGFTLRDTAFGYFRLRAWDVSNPSDTALADRVEIYFGSFPETTRFYNIIELGSLPVSLTGNQMAIIASHFKTGSWWMSTKVANNQYPQVTPMAFVANSAGKIKIDIHGNILHQPGDSTFFYGSIKEKP